MNITILKGQLAAEPQRTDLASGATVRNYELRADDPVGGRSRVPVAWVDAVRPPSLHEGDEVVVVGAVRRRWFRTGGGSASRTEVVASVVAKPGSVRVERALEAALAEVARTRPFG